MSFCDALEDEVLDQVFGGSDYLEPSTWYIGLSTTTPTDAGGNFTEPTGGSYARKDVTNNKTTFTNSSSGAVSNAIEIAFVQATGDWGTVTYFGVFSAVSGGTPLATGQLSPSRNITSGSTAKFAIGELDVTLD